MNVICELGAHAQFENSGTTYVRRKVKSQHKKEHFFLQKGQRLVLEINYDKPYNIHSAKMKIL